MQIEKAAGALGAYVDVDLKDVAQSADLFADLQDALFQHEVLFVRDQSLSAPEYAKLGARFGIIEPHPAYPMVPGAPDVQILESTPAEPSKIEVWHSDMTFRPAPPAITLLYGQVIPAYGGDTIWASARAAYEGLSPAIQTLLADLTAVNDFTHGFQESLREPGGHERLQAAIAENPPIEHPVVRTHPVSGTRSIYVNALFTTRIEGLTRRESDTMLAFLFREVTTQEYTVRLSWQPGTVAIWDNRSTQHRPVNDFFPQHRRMYRITIVGEHPK